MVYVAPLYRPPSEASSDFAGYHRVFTISTLLYVQNQKYRIKSPKK